MMRVPFMDLERLHGPIRERLLKRITAVVDSGRFILGPEVERFERELAAYVDATDAVGVSSGTDALLVSLMALGVGPGDEVVTTALTFFATAGAIARLGATPVFADIDPVSLNLDPAAALARFTPRTKVVLPVHLFGRVADIEPLRAVCEERGVAIVEDAAQAIGAKDAAGRNAGTLGALGCISFFPAKNLGAFGDAGGVTTNDPELADRVRLLRAHGARPKYHHAIVGGNFRLDALQAAVLSEKLEGLERATNERRGNAQRYQKLFGETGLLTSGALRTPDAGPGRHVYHQYVIRTPERGALQRWLAERDIGSMIYYPEPLHVQPCFDHLAAKRGDLPETERAAGEMLALPIFPGLRRDEQETVVAAIASFYARGQI